MWTGLIRLKHRKNICEIKKKKKKYFLQLSEEIYLFQEYVKTITDSKK